MSVVETSTYCATCERRTLHHKQRVNHVLHLILSVLTVGLWALFVWLPLGMKNSATRMRCTVCGNKPGIQSARHEVTSAFLGTSPLQQLAETIRLEDEAQRPVAARLRASAPAHVADDEIPPSTWLPPGARESRA